MINRFEFFLYFGLIYLMAPIALPITASAQLDHWSTITTKNNLHVSCLKFIWNMKWIIHKFVVFYFIINWYAQVLLCFLCEVILLVLGMAWAFSSYAFSVIRYVTAGWGTNYDIILYHQASTLTSQSSLV